MYSHTHTIETHFFGNEGLEEAVKDGGEEIAIGGGHQLLQLFLKNFMVDYRPARRGE